MQIIEVLFIISADLLAKKNKDIPTKHTRRYTYTQKYKP